MCFATDSCMACGTRNYKGGSSSRRSWLSRRCWRGPFPWKLRTSWCKKSISPKAWLQSERPPPSWDLQWWVRVRGWWSLPHPMQQPSATLTSHPTGPAVPSKDPEPGVVRTTSIGPAVFAIPNAGCVARLAPLSILAAPSQPMNSQAQQSWGEGGSSQKKTSAVHEEIHATSMDSLHLSTHSPSETRVTVKIKGAWYVMHLDTRSPISIGKYPTAAVPLENSIVQPIHLKTKDWLGAGLPHWSRGLKGSAAWVVGDAYNPSSKAKQVSLHLYRLQIHP